MAEAETTKAEATNELKPADLKSCRFSGEVVAVFSCSVVPDFHNIWNDNGNQVFCSNVPYGFCF